jgi:hypothetical protein
MISSSQVEWHGLILRGSRGIDGVDFGEVREVDSDYVITERGVNNEERFHIPKQEVQGYDNNRVYFRLTEEEARQHLRR